MFQNEVDFSVPPLELWQVVKVHAVQTRDVTDGLEQGGDDRERQHNVAHLGLLVLCR